MCLDVDNVGIASHFSTRDGTMFGVGADVGLVLRYTRGITADKIGDGTSFSWEIGFEGHGLFGGGLAGGEDRSSDGTLSKYMEYEIGVGKNFSFGGTFDNKGENSGYLLKW